MKPKKRQSEIAEIIGQNGQMSVDALALRFGVSAETIRRDLSQLASDGSVQKIHGGARRLRLHAEGSFQDRMVEDADAKRLIAGKLAEIVEPGDTLFMDTGSTTLFCAEAIAGVGHLTVITNSVKIAQVMSAPGTSNSVYLVGGLYSGDNSQSVGPLVIEQLDTFQADYAVLTVAAIDSEAGMMDSNFDEARVARKMIDRARQVIVVATASKFERLAAYRVCDLREVDVLVLDRAPPRDLADALQSAGVDLR